MSRRSGVVIPDGSNVWVPQDEIELLRGSSTAQALVCSAVSDRDRCVDRRPGVIELRRFDLVVATENLARAELNRVRLDCSSNTLELAADVKVVCVAGLDRFLTLVAVEMFSTPTPTIMSKSVVDVE